MTELQIKCKNSQFFALQVIYSNNGYGVLYVLPVSQKELGEWRGLNSWKSKGLRAALSPLIKCVAASKCVTCP